MFLWSFGPLVQPAQEVGADVQSSPPMPVNQGIYLKCHRDSQHDLRYIPKTKGHWALGVCFKMGSLTAQELAEARDLCR